MTDYTDNHEYIIMNQQYVGLISFGLIGLMFETIVLGISHEQINIGTVLHLAADCAACFWISWIILDGFDWQTYIYIFTFCVIAPVIYDALVLGQYFIKNQWLAWHKPESWLDVWRYRLQKKYYEWFSRRI